MNCENFQNHEHINSILDLLYSLQEIRSLVSFRHWELIQRDPCQCISARKMSKLITFLSVDGQGATD